MARFGCMKNCNGKFQNSWIVMAFLQSWRIVMVGIKKTLSFLVQVLFCGFLFFALRCGTHFTRTPHSLWCHDFFTAHQTVNWSTGPCSCPSVAPCYICLVLFTRAYWMWYILQDMRRLYSTQAVSVCGLNCLCFWCLVHNHVFHC